MSEGKRKLVVGISYGAAVTLFVVVLLHDSGVAPGRGWADGMAGWVAVIWEWAGWRWLRIAATALGVLALVAWERARRDDIARLAYRCAMLERMVFRLKQTHRSPKDHEVMMAALGKNHILGIDEDEARSYADEMDRWSDAAGSRQNLPWLP